MSSTKIHYSGRILIMNRRGVVTEVFGGFAACCSGTRTRKIAAEGRTTLASKDVTCRKCKDLVASFRKNFPWLGRKFPWFELGVLPIPFRTPPGHNAPSSMNDDE